MIRRQENQLRVDEIGRDLAGWAVGLGLLRLHLAVFSLGATGLVLLNLYRAPTESWSVDAIRLWAIALACHATALLAGWSTWRAVRPHRLPKAAPGGPIAVAVHAAAQVRLWPGASPAPSGHAAPIQPATADWVQPATGNGVSSNGHAPEPSPLALPVRGRFSPPTSQPPVVRHAWRPPNAAFATSKLRASAGGAMHAGRTGWRRFSRATQAGISAATARLAGTERRTGSPVPPAGSSPTPVTDQTSPPGWPAPPPVPEVLAVPPGWEAVVSPPQLPPVSSPTISPPSDASFEEFPGWAPPPPVQPAIDVVAAGPPASAEAPAQAMQQQGTSPETAEEPPLPTETEWTWMEAAAAAWLARRESDEPGDSSGNAAPTPSGQG
jgi:hypothetical protein